METTLVNKSTISDINRTVSFNLKESYTSNPFIFIGILNTVSPSSTVKGKVSARHTSVATQSTPFSKKFSEERSELITNIDKLDSYLGLKLNWNDNNALAFTPVLINKVKKIIQNIVIQPFISPVASGSIQLEYEFENGNYLEFEVFEDSIKMFSIIDAIESSQIIQENEILYFVKDFYAHR